MLCVMCVIFFSPITAAQRTTKRNIMMEDRGGNRIKLYPVNMSNGRTHSPHHDAARSKHMHCL